MYAARFCVERELTFFSMLLAEVVVVGSNDEAFWVCLYVSHHACSCCKQYSYALRECAKNGSFWHIDSLDRHLHTLFGKHIGINLDVYLLWHNLHTIYLCKVYCLDNGILDIDDAQRFGRNKLQTIEFLMLGVYCCLLW